ncbi:helix-turn-helix domain-containing protein, partial [uncultured Dokdonia sp.]|uniref:helix-turn-helix domain-containing protein n=1 Tax=uncultured Dokdonia sp. TaxID=575653 RepID=UPI002605CB4C
LQAINELNNEYTIDPSLKMNKVLDYMSRIDYKESISLIYYHIGKSHLNNNHKELAVTYFLKVDSVIDNSESILPETFEGYRFLKNYYEKKGDVENELKYLKKIYAFDSILDTNYKSINNTIKTKYELPILLENHKNKIDALDRQNKKSKSILLVSFGLLGIVLLFLTYSLIQKNKYKKRFQQLQENNISKKTKEKSKKPQEKPNIPDEIFTKTEAYLKEFEKKQQFLIQSMNSEKLAQQIGTNRPYFSKAFTYLKNESFNVYLRNLRLEYALGRLREDATFRKYTIKTIANESGFSNAESFSKFFYRKYGIYPSYYIKSIEKIIRKQVYILK